MGEKTEIRVAIVEDHDLYRELLTTSLAATDGITVVGSYSGVVAAKNGLNAGDIDVALLDIELGDGNGVALGVSLRRADPDLSIVLLSARDMVELLLGIPDDIRHGWSYLSKTSVTSLSTLVSTIRATSQGDTVLDPTLVARSFARRGTPVSALTNRQFEILRMVARGLANQTIADELGIANNSVVNHLSAIYASLNIAEGQNARVSAVLEFLNDTSRPVS
ncbi:MAG: DNA-binding NarL/FixJ family response regulator [Alpinimonas sp.]|jgi:DNA-binding NarL/FixJ family response regulator